MGKYEVLEELGSGAMGVVYKARDPIINRLVALKKIKANVADSPSLLERFYREAQSAGSLQHPNIVTIYEMGEEEGVPFIAMQLVDGQNLGNLIAQRAPIPLSLKLVYAVEACRAFAYAHKQGIVHRDIKPGNVMVSKEGAVKVVDFGIARVLENSKTQTGMLIGTFAYMPPEVYNGEHADERSDIFSFGVLLYELFAYTRPFPGDIPASLMQSICLKEPIPLRQVAPECPPELEAVVHRTLVKSVTERTQSMEDLLLELDPICKGLQAQTSADLLAQAKILVQDRELARARELLIQALQVDFTNRPARALLDEVNTDLKRILIRPRVEKHVNAGRAFLEEGRIQEAQSEAESAIKLDSNFGPAEELLQQVQKEIGRAKLISEWLHASGERLAEGLPEEAEAFLIKIQEVDPANRQAAKLLEQVFAEKATRQRRIHLLETMQQARALWMQQKFGDCINLLTSLRVEFGDEEEVQKLLVTAREDQAEQHKRQTLERARTLLATGSFGECKPLLTDLCGQFPNDEEILGLLEQVRKDEAEQRKLEALKEVRNLLAARCYDDCFLLLASLKSEFPGENEIAKLVEAVHADQEAEKKQRGLLEARSLLASQRYDECRAVLTGLLAQFQADPEISRLLDNLHEEQAEQRRLKGLQEARKMFASKQYAESLALLNELKTQFPGDREILILADAVHKEQEEQQKQESLSEAQYLLASKQYAQSLALLNELGRQFPDDTKIPALAEQARKEQAEQKKLEGLSQAQNLLASKQYVQSLALLNELGNQFPDDTKIPALAEQVRKEQAEQKKLEGLSQAQKLLASKQYPETLALLNDLKKQFPDDRRIPTLAEEVQKEQAEQQKLQGLATVRKLRASRQYAESLALLSELKKQFPDDKQIPMLAMEIAQDQAEQRRLVGLQEARKLLASKQYAESLSLLTELKTQFPSDKEILRLVDAVRKDQSEQQRQQLFAKARKLRGAKQFAEALALLEELKTQFPDDKEIPSLADGVRKDQAEQRKLQGLSEARNLLTARRLEEALALLMRLRDEFPQEDAITRLLGTVEQERAEQQKQQQLAEARALLGSEQFGKALAVIDRLLAANPKDAGVLKLRALVLGEQEKVARAARLTHELQVLKKLVSEESYEIVIAKAKELLHDFTNDVDLVRLLEFARSRKEQVERELRLNHIVEEVQKFIASNQLVEAIAAARHGLGSFEGNSDLKRLLEHAESQRKKEFTRLQIQQRVREIKIKIHREEFSDAVRLAQDALTTWGPDTDLTQLLTSAQVETRARDKKRVQGRMLEKVRALLELGDPEGATLLLDNTIKTEGLETTDPRVVRLSADIAAATSTKDQTAKRTAQDSPAKEYAFLEGPPQIGAPEEQSSTEEQTAPLNSAMQVAPSLPQSELAAQGQVAPDTAIPEVEIDAVAVSQQRGDAPQSEGLPLVRLWKKPSMLVLGLLGLFLAVSAGIYFLNHSNSSQGVSHNTSQPVAPPSAKNLPETQQRDLIGAADKAVAQGDFKGAKTALEQAKNMNGPLNTTIDQKLADIEKAINNSTTAAVLRQEETLWSQATADTQNGKFVEAQQTLQSILTLSSDGRRKAEARQYLTDVIPRRQREEKMFAQAQQTMNGKDSRSFQQAADLFGEVAKLNGPREQAALKNQQDALANLNKFNAIATLTDGARQDMKRGDFRSARQKAAQVQQSGSDSAPLSQEIDKAEQGRFSQLDATLSQLKQRPDEGAVQSLRELQLQFQTLADGGGPTTNDARRDAASIPDAILGVQARVTYERDEGAFQQAVQKYHTNPNDKGALDASRSDFQSIVKGGGHRTADAQKIVDEINAKVAVLNQPPNPTRPNPTPDVTPDVLAAVQRYAGAFNRRDVDALKQVWPTMTVQDYGKLKSAFGGASEIQLQVANEKVDLGSDGETAVVNADIIQNYTPKGGKARVSRDHTVFHFVKSNGVWVIKELR